MLSAFRSPLSTLFSPFSFSKQDSALLKGYGILFMVFHHCFKQYSLPAEINTAWIPEELTRLAPIFKICVFIFIFITGYALSLKTCQHASPITFLKRGTCHYMKFWKTYFLSLLLVIMVSWLIPTPALITPDKLDWKAWVLSFCGFCSPYADWWYMGLFAFGCMVLYPVASLITYKTTPVISLINLLIFSILLHAILPIAPKNILMDIIRFSPLFILGYTCALVTTRIEKTSRKEYNVALLVLVIEIGLIHFLSFSTALKWTIPFLFSIWVLPWLTKKLFLTGFLMRLGQYSALMWLNHRFIFGYHFSRALYGTQSSLLVYGLTLLGSFLLAVALQWMFQKIFLLFFQLGEKIIKKAPLAEAS